MRDKTNDVVARKEEARKKRRKKKATASLVSSCFQGGNFYAACKTFIIRKYGKDSMTYRFAAGLQYMLVIG